MMRWVILAVLIVGVTAAVTVTVQYLPASTPVGAPRTDSGPAPKLVLLDDLIHNFGVMSQQDEGTHSWKIRNEGEGELKLTFAHKSCGCTSVEFNGEPVHAPEGEEPRQVNHVRSLGPGEEATITLAWATEEKMGNFSTEATFVTNDYQTTNSTLVLMARGEVLPGVMAPEQVTLGTVSNEDTARSTVPVFSPTQPDFQVESATTSRPEMLKAEVRSLTDEEREHLELESGYAIDLILMPGMPLGDFRDELIIKTDHPSRPELRIPIDGKVVGAITAMPERLSWYGINGKQGGSKVITLSVRGQESTRFEPELTGRLQEALDVRIEPVNASASTPMRQYRLTITVPPGTPSGRFSGQLVLKTDHPQASELKIPVDAVVLASN
ncbi:hypothetical protein BH23PLA1_BH23PLA1_29640 [soil metagenome]